MIILGFLISISLNGQYINEFYFEMNNAAHLTKTGKLKDAVIAYEGAFKKTEYIHVVYLRKVLTLAKKNNNRASIVKYNNQIKKQLKGKNPYLSNILDSVMNIDQSVRTLKYKNAIKYYDTCIENENCDENGRKFISCKKLRNEKISVDSLNLEYLIYLFDKHGFIGEEQIGSKFPMVDVLLFHFCYMENSYLMIPFLESALRDGRILPLRYAQIMDLYYYSSNYPQKYWMWCQYEVHTSALSKHDVEVILSEREGIGIYSSELLQEKSGEFWVFKNKFEH